MAITVKYLTGLGVDEETANKIFAERGKEIEADKAKYTELENKLTEKKNSFNTLTQEFEQLKANNASAEDYKTKLEQLQTEIAEKETKAKEEQAAKEKADMIKGRFDTVVGDRKFTHDAIKADYLHKFGEALKSKDFTGKSDADIFHELIKDDKTALENVTVTKLPGGNDRSMGEDIDEAHVRAIMGLPPTNK